MQVPEQLIHSLRGLKGFDEAAFRQVHDSGEQVTSIRANPFKKSIVNSEWSIIDYSPLTIHNNIPWSQYGYYLSERPSFTFDPLFHAGCYYVQEASSMFLEQAVKQTVDLSQPLKVFDLCAAPGGKSTHLQSLISKDSLLVSNEVIRQRANILKENIIKWGGANVIVTNNDPKDFSAIKNYFDLIVVDAPCSGSGLFRKDPEAIGEWSENNVMLCSQRQQRVLADILPSLKPGGVLVYATCSYSKQEDEDITDWLCGGFPVVNIRLDIDRFRGMTETITRQNRYGYRFWPHLVKGEGFFLAVFKKTDEVITKAQLQKPVAKPVSQKDMELLKHWLQDESLSLVSFSEKLYAWPQHLAKDFDLIAQKLRVIYSGVLVGEIKQHKLIPHHALAMSSLLNDQVPGIELGLQQAVSYLQKKDFELKPERMGWQTVTFKGFRLGWINVLQNRFNNYYPMEMRILKDKPFPAE